MTNIVKKNNSTIIVGDLKNTTLNNGQKKKKINKDIEDLENIINQLNLTHLYRNLNTQQQIAIVTLQNILLEILDRATRQGK